MKAGGVREWLLLGRDGGGGGASWRLLEAGLTMSTPPLDPLKRFTDRQEGGGECLGGEKWWVVASSGG